MPNLNQMYTPEEVDEIIKISNAQHEKILMEHEKVLMDERLKLLEAEKKIMAFKQKWEEVEKREKNITIALERFKKQQNEGNRNIELLRGEQLRVIYLNLQSFLQEINKRYPGAVLSETYKRLVSDIESVLAKNDSRRDEIVGIGTDNDPMRLLLLKMQDKRSAPKEVKVERVVERPSQIKPVCEMELKEDDKFDNLVDKFLSTRPEEPKVNRIQSSGFDLKEAISPTQDLSEIMKAFDFYNPDEE